MKLDQAVGLDHGRDHVQSVMAELGDPPTVQQTAAQVVAPARWFVVGKVGHDPPAPWLGRRLAIKPVKPVAILRISGRATRAKVTMEATGFPGNPTKGTAPIRPTAT